MNAKELQFIFDGFADVGRSIALGRCGDLPIHVGDVFDLVYRNKRRRYPDEMGDDPIREVEKPAAIRVVGIHAYERRLKTLGEGMTGALTLEETVRNTSHLAGIPGSEERKPVERGAEDRAGGHGRLKSWMTMGET